MVLAGDAPNHGHRADAQRLPEFDGFLLDLLGQLAGGRQNNGVGTLVGLLNPAGRRGTAASPPCCLPVHPPHPPGPSRRTHRSILGRVVIHTSSGMRNAAVLPLPVSATPMMSRFCRPMGMAWRWMGVGSWPEQRQQLRAELLLVTPPPPPQTSPLPPSPGPLKAPSRAHLVATLVDDLQDVGGQGGVLPGADGVGDLAPLGGDAVILAEDAPVPVRHLVQLLLGPVPVVPALLGLLLPQLPQPCPGRERAGTGTGTGLTLELGGGWSRPSTHPKDTL